eukprot:scaffold29011_cov38-Cyclotella_meneghiniana.AAC.3
MTLEISRIFIVPSTTTNYQALSAPRAKAGLHNKNNNSGAWCDDHWCDGCVESINKICGVYHRDDHGGASNGGNQYHDAAEVRLSRPLCTYIHTDDDG